MKPNEQVVNIADRTASDWEALNRISAHEAMCEERSKTIFNRLDKIDETLGQSSRNFFSLAVVLICGMAGIITTLLLGL